MGTVALSVYRGFFLLHAFYISAASRALVHSAQVATAAVVVVEKVGDGLIHPLVYHLDL